MKDTKDLYKDLPLKPGVYLMHDDAGKVIYVGKAKSLRKRVSSYFRHAGFASPRLQKLVTLINDISVIRTESEAEALILESRLIKQYQPFFNVALKMGERYPYIRITDEAYPRIVVTRHVSSEGGLYLGPYVKTYELRGVLHFIERYMPLRACKGELKPDASARPCLKHALGRCTAPCVGLFSQEDYKERTADIVLLLQGRGVDLVERLRSRMDKAASNLEFEEAANLRDAIKAIWRIGRQKPDVTVSPFEDEPWEVLKAVSDRLGLASLPWRIEGYDISHTAGGEAVGVCVTFEQGRPNPSKYRRFNLEASLEGDDFRALYETLSRRFKDAQAAFFPQLLLIDGGPVQLSFAQKALSELGVDIPAVSLAKRNEEIFLPNVQEPLLLARNDNALRLLQQVRDEAHRYAVSSHTKRRDKKFRSSRLEDIPGIGKRKATELLSRFGSAKAISRMDLNTIASVPGIGPILGERILSGLREKDDEQQLSK